LIEKFIAHLESRSKGEGALSYYRRFKKMLKHAYRKGVIKVNVLDFVEKKVRGKAAKKDILTLDEIKVLFSKPIESDEVRKAAIFSLMTGLAWVDVKNLKWSNVDFTNKVLHNAYRSKTEEPIVVPLNDAAIKILDKFGKEDEFIFNLPSANGANKTLKAWVKRAGINKKITWHNLRHSAGTNLAYAGVDILTISKVLSHSTTKHTMRYVDAANEMKIKAMENLNVEL
jgi:integrase